MATKLDELLETLSEAIQLFEEDSEQYWLRLMRRSKARLMNSDYSGIEHLLSAYGGDGFFQRSGDMSEL